MAIVRGPRPADRFAQISNSALQDASLSFRARGVLAFLLSLRPGARITVEEIAARGSEGRDAIRAALRELERTGSPYLIRRRHRDGRGNWVWDQYVYDDPRDARAVLEALAAEADPSAGNPPMDPTSENSASPLVSPSAGNPSADNQRITTKKKNFKKEKKGRGHLGGGSSPSVPPTSAPKPPTENPADDDGSAAPRYPNQCTNHQDGENDQANGGTMCPGCASARRAHERLAGLREARIREARQALDLAAECPHGQPGGNQPHPAAPERLWCLLCQHGRASDDVPTPTAADTAALARILGRADETTSLGVMPSLLPEPTP